MVARAACTCPTSGQRRGLVRTLSAFAAMALVFSVRGARADEVIEDPELAAVPHETLVAPPPANGPKDTTWRASIHSRWGVDTDWDRASQDVLQGTTIASLEAEQRRSDTLMLSAGVRMRHGFAMHRNGDARYELDVAPLSLFADVTPGAGYHVRAGYQIITMGRFDLFSATNFLATYDLRSGPVTMAEASAVATPSLRFDFDKVRGFTLQAFYVPFFVPHIVSLYGSDYSLLSPLDRAHLPANIDQFRTALEKGIGRSALTNTGTSALQAFAPAADLRSPQGAIRATVYGSAGELSVTLGTALEPLPSPKFSPAFSAYLDSVRAGMAVPQAQADAAIANRPIQLDHPRYEIASIDAAIDAGPIQLGAEFAYMFHRSLTGAQPGMDVGDAPMTQLEYVNMAQLGVRAEYVEGTEWAVVLESFAAIASRTPSNPAYAWIGFDGRNEYGIAAAAHFTPEKSRFKFELAGAALAVSTYMVMPRIEWEALNAFFLELGGVFVEGTHPGPLGSHPYSLGGLYTDVDQVFVGARWSP
ncbi:MAG TPA: hypothetical protein VH062_25775 [Polyangiaceae bacterium]|nr:hypothetical protein [Polyangiaceae bacterium]